MKTGNHSCIWPSMLACDMIPVYNCFMQMRFSAPGAATSNGRVLHNSVRRSNVAAGGGGRGKILVHYVLIVNV